MISSVSSDYLGATLLSSSNILRGQDALQELSKYAQENGDKSHAFPKLLASIDTKLHTTVYVHNALSIEMHMNEMHTYHVHGTLFLGVGDFY